MQRVAASAEPHGMTPCIVAAYPRNRGERTVGARPPATDPLRRAQAGGSLPSPSRVWRGELGSPEDERIAHGRAQRKKDGRSQRAHHRPADAVPPVVAPVGLKR